MAAQRPDVIVKDDEKLDLYSNPLEEYWLKNKLKRPAFCAEPYCKRGYVATWAIRNDRLYLINIEGLFTKNTFLGKKVVQFSLYTLFPDNNGSVYVDWFTGKLRIPNGPMKHYVHQGYDSRFEKEIIISIDRGNITKEVILDYANKTLIVQ